MSDDMVREFLMESNENLDSLDRELVRLEKDPGNRDTLASVFRTIHTIKGTCGFLGFTKLESVAHVGENLLSKLRDGQLTLSPEITSALQKTLSARVRSIQKLPAMPVILKPLLELLRDDPDRVNVKKVVEMVAQDKSIVAQCLRIATSPVFARARATESIAEAVMSLGIERVKEVVLSLNQIVPKGKWATDPAAFWRHSLGCALVCKEFAERIGFQDAERAYLAGLLHDLGITVNAGVSGGVSRGV